MKASDYIAAFIAKQGVTHVFELTGGLIAHILDSMYLRGELQVVSCHHEQVASFSADAYGRLNGVPGVAMATGGPGATNLMTGIGSCYFDSAPAVFITGAVNRHEMRGDRDIRQLGFQEMEIVKMVEPITKGAWQVSSVDELPALLTRAFTVALAGRPGPTLLDIPMDIQYADLDASVDDIPVVTREIQPDPADFDFDFDILFKALDQAERPFILAGGGVRAAGAADLLRSFARQTGIPVINSLMGVDVMPYGDRLQAGFIGAYGNRWANVAIMESDLMLVLGSRLDIRQTGAKTDDFRGERMFFHVDAQQGEMNNRITNVHPIHADLHTFLTAALQAVTGRTLPDYSTWVDHIAQMRADSPDTAEIKGMDGINPNAFLHALSQASTGAGTYVVDVGQHQMWAAQSVEVSEHQRFITSGGMGAMGYALGAAVGAAFASVPQPVVVIAGDGGFQVNIQDFETIAHHNLPIKMVVLNNQAHGMVRQFQSSYFDARWQSTVWGYSVPNFMKVAEAYGIPGQSVDKPADIDAALAWLWADPNAPALLDVKIPLEANAYPKIAFGRPISEMEPDYEPAPFGEAT